MDELSNQDNGQWQAPKDRIFNIPPVIMASVIGLVAIHVILYFLGPNWQVYAIFAFSFIPARFDAANSIPQLPGAAYWTMLSYGLLHGSAFHVATNCFWLAIFGTPVARRLSASRFFALAAIATVGGAVATLVLRWNEFITLVGASAAVSGLMAASGPHYVWSWLDGCPDTQHRSGTVCARSAPGPAAAPQTRACIHDGLSGVDIVFWRFAIDRRNRIIGGNQYRMGSASGWFSGGAVCILSA